LTKLPSIPGNNLAIENAKFLQKFLLQAYTTLSTYQEKKGSVRTKIIEALYTKSGAASLWEMAREGESGRGGEGESGRVGEWESGRGGEFLFIAQYGLLKVCLSLRFGKAIAASVCHIVFLRGLS